MVKEKDEAILLERRKDKAVCTTCNTEFYVDGGIIKCNGFIIRMCPWCRKDSRPWRQGRGQ